MTTRPVSTTEPPAPAAGGSRARMPADERRAQLVAIGLSLLTTRPIHELALDEVAAEAGISRGLLFHYFPTKSDYYAAVVAAAAERLLRPDRDPLGQTPQERVSAMVSAFLRIVGRNRELYLALVRGASGGDPAVVAILGDIRASLVPRWLAAAGVDDVTPRQRLAVRGFLAALEEVALVWSVAADDIADGDVLAMQGVPRDDVVADLTAALFHALER